MFGKYLHRTLPALLLALLFGCQKERNDAPAETSAPREPASLVLTADLSALIYPQGTRTTNADDNTIHHVSLFLIDYLEDRLVAYRNIYPDTQAALHAYDDTDDNNGFVNPATGKVDPQLTSGTSVRVSFPYDEPLHGLAEKLSRGSYVLLAMANYSESDLFGNSGIAVQIQDLIEQFLKTPHTGIGGFKANYAHFYDLQLRIPRKTGQDGSSYAPYVRPRSVSIPLSCTQTLNLISGQNRSSAELKHTCARVRIDVCNYSEQPLEIRELSLSRNFTQSACYLFSRLDRSENYAIENEHDGKGAPITTDGNALTPFVTGSMLTREMGPTTLFDGLIYESRDLTENYTYTIDVSYGQEDLKRYELANDGQAITRLSELQTLGPYFLIRRSDADQFLYVDNDQVFVSDGTQSPQQILDLCASKNYYYNYVWKLEWSGNGSKCYLRNVQTEDFVEKIRYNNLESSSYRLRMVTQQSADIFNVNTTGQFFSFRSTGFTGGDAYINVRADKADSPVVGWYGDGTWSQFALFPVSQVSGLGTRQEVVLKTINPTSGVVSDVHEIQRNDFIRVLVEVSYNPDKGDFDFIVNDWNTAGGDITFN